jgi:salicylate hydroxylase
MTQLKVAIVGCGVAGSVLAYSLSRTPGVQVVCYEKASLEDHSEAGTGLNVGPNAIKVLLQAEPELAADVLAASYAWSSWRCSDTAGKVIFDFPLADCAVNAGIRIRWSELYRVLRAPLAPFAHFGTQVLRVEEDRHQPGTFIVESRTGAGPVRRDAGFDLIVATDGRYSVLRPQFAGEWTPRHVPSTIYRLLVPDTSGGLMGDYAWWFNGNKRLLAFKVPPGHVYIAGSFALPFAGAEIPEADKAPDAMARHYFPAQGEPCAEVKWMVEQLTLHHDQIHWARLQETPPLFAAPGGRVLFLGDSAHGMVPTLGQGATQAVEDAVCAAGVIREALTCPSFPRRRESPASDFDSARPARADGALLKADAGDSRLRGNDGSGGNVGEEDLIPRITAEISRRRLARVQWVMDLSLDATKAMLAGGDPQRDMGRLTGAEWQEHLTRLWSVREPAPFLQAEPA